MTAKSPKPGLQTKSIVRVAIVTLVLLSIPLLAMVFSWPIHDPGSPATERVNWTVFDFVVMGALIFGTGLVYEYLKGRVGDRTNRMILAIVLLGAFFLIWAELAVGIFGTPFAGS